MAGPLRRPTVSVWTLGLVCAWLASAAPAFAQTSAGNKAAAEALFNEGRTLMQAEDYQNACKKLEASQALDVGLVNRVFATHEELVSGVLAIAREIAARSPLAVWGSKEMINYARDHTIADGLDYIATWQTGMFQPADMLESFAAKSQKRDPVFPDLLPIKDKM